MPISVEFRHFYGREWRDITRPRILKRANDRCEQCGAPNHTELKRIGGCWLEIVASWKEGITRAWRDAKGRFIDSAPRGRLRTVRIVLTIAHLNHTPGDDRHENLKALCQWCHLNYDAAHHHETRAARKDAARPLLLKQSQETA